MNLQRMDPVLMAGMVAGMVWLFVHGWLLPGFILAALILAALAYLYGAESPDPPFSKEEELAMWGVKWELDNPIRRKSPGRRVFDRLLHALHSLDRALKK